MKKRVISFVLSLIMLLSACVLCFTGCTPQEEPAENTNAAQNNEAATLVMWCVTENEKVLNEAGELVFDEETEAQMKEVVKQMTAITQSQLKTKLIVKYLTMEEYYEKLEEALAWQQAQAEAEAEKDKNNKNDKNDKEEEVLPEEEEEDSEIKYDEDGNPIIDTTNYPELTEEQLQYQVDILYLSGYDKYMDYISGYGKSSKELGPDDKKWLASLNSELSGNAKKISNFVSGSLLNAPRFLSISRLPFLYISAANPS
jgi:hypothetical protein